MLDMSLQEKRALATDKLNNRLFRSLIKTRATDHNDRCWKVVVDDINDRFQSLNSVVMDISLPRNSLISLLKNINDRYRSLISVARVFVETLVIQRPISIVDFGRWYSALLLRETVLFFPKLTKQTSGTSRGAPTHDYRYDFYIYVELDYICVELDYSKTNYDLWF